MRITIGNYKNKHLSKINWINLIKSMQKKNKLTNKISKKNCFRK